MGRRNRRKTGTRNRRRSRIRNTEKEVEKEDGEEE